MEFASLTVEYLINGLFKTAEKIRHTVKTVKANRYQCTRLSQRIDTILDILRKDTMTKMKSIDRSLEKALGNFQNFLEECLSFMKQFGQRGWFRRAIHHQNHATQFRKFNEELSQHCQDLNFGFAYLIYHKFLKEDVEDAKNDSEEIAEIIHSKKPLLTQRIQTIQVQNTIPPRITTVIQDQHRNRFLWQNSIHGFYPRNRRARSHHAYVPKRFY